MAREFKRTDRVADAIQRILAQAVQHEIRDPRVGMVNVNDVDVTRDLAYAKVFVTFVDDQTNPEEAIEALNKASGFLRSILAKEMDMRIIPRLSFIYDKTSIRGQALSSLITKAVAEDESKRDDEDDDNNQNSEDQH